jgi:hypothetical protein
MSFMDWPLSKFHEMEDKKMTDQILDLKARITFLEKKIDTRETHIAQLIEEKAELQRRNENQAETIIRLRAELEMYQ